MERKDGSKKHEKYDNKDNIRNQECMVISNNSPGNTVTDRYCDETTKIEGRNPVIEALKSGRTIEKIYVSKGSYEGSIRQIISMAREGNMPILEIDRAKMDFMSETKNHQGVIAIASPYKYSDVDEILEYAEEKHEPPFIVILDEICDPHNLGSILRTADACGVHGVIIPKRRAVGLTPAVAKTSAGAVEYVKVAKVTNVTSTIRLLKKKGVWIVGADMDGKRAYFEADLKGPIALVIGNEGTGIGRLVKENCDFLVDLPMRGKIASLNASVAAGILMYEVLRQRIYKR
ncbi:MAG: 23S rRNA (guanosine(2251)-2'-O)-methyltransferase RlmB [Clostridiales bacterium]|nr:23S rRNA (guanosine(2251)-2'-O)-methyltransferase RlmB [Clostridiales bacterium]HBM80334.1 23S rRNA (guanosine(2251)-2'-O)-methyltransferase RlmB [Clostridiaceae bacterium]